MWRRPFELCGFKCSVLHIKVIYLMLICSQISSQCETRSWFTVLAITYSIARSICAAQRSSRLFFYRRPCVSFCDTDPISSYSIVYSYKATREDELDTLRVLVLVYQLPDFHRHVRVVISSSIRKSNGQLYQNLQTVTFYQRIGI